MIEEKITCMHRFCKDCTRCKEDYDLNHHPNNKDCPNYTEVKVHLYEVKNGKQKKFRT